MRLRVGVTQAILHDAQVLFLDEPTSGPEPMGVRHLRGIIDRLRDRGMTLFMNTHLLSEVARRYTSIGVLAQGRLGFQDRISALEGYDERALEELYVGVAQEDAA